jgi:hypothetical protein
MSIYIFKGCVCVNRWGDQTISFLLQSPLNLVRIALYQISLYFIIARKQHPITLIESVPNMRLVNFTLLALSCNTILAAPIDASVKNVAAAETTGAAQDTSTLQRAIKDVVDSTADLVVSLQSLDRIVKLGGNPGPYQNEIVSFSEDLITNLKDGAAQVKAMPALYTFESMGMLSTVQSLVDHVQKTVNAWIAAKSSIVKTGGKDAALDILQRQSVASDEFAAAIVSKMPFAAVPTAMRYSTKSKSSIQQAIQAFKGW